MARITLNITGSTVDIAVPQSSAGEERRLFPTLWLLHDFGGNHADWFRYTNIELSAQKNGLVIICPSGDNSNYEDGGGGEYFSYLTEKLRRMMGVMLPVSALPEDNVIAGVGMGGYGALAAALARPDYYGAAVAVCPERAGGFMDEHLEKDVTAPNKSRIMLFGDCGAAAGIAAKAGCRVERLAYAQKPTLDTLEDAGNIIIDASLRCIGKKRSAKF